MNFPAQGLAIIGPILFIVLMVAFPLIGVFGGWKRAAYWGGGNLVFYLLGLGIWAGAHAALGNAMLGWLSSVIQDFPADRLKDFASSITAPIFFLIIVVAGNLFLLLNYYFWFKRVAKIRKKDDKANLENNTLPSKKYRIISMVAGGVGMPVLMLPTTLSATQAAMFVTTSAATRENNAFAAGLYGGLAKLSEAFGGLSYYGITKSAQDFDALWAAQGLTKDLTEPIISPTGETLTGTVQEALEKIIDQGFEKVVNGVKTGEQSSFNAAIAAFAPSWNALLDQQKNVVEPLFSSDSATKIIEDILPVPVVPIEIDPTNFATYWGDEGFLKTWLQAVPADTFTQVSISSTGLNNLRNAMDDYYDLSKLQPEDQATFEVRISDMIQMLFKVE